MTSVIKRETCTQIHMQGECHAKTEVTLPQAKELLEARREA